MAETLAQSGDVFPPNTYTNTVSQDLVNTAGKFADVVLDVETIGSGTLTLTIRGRTRSRRATNTPGGAHAYYTILAGAAVSATNTPTAANIYRVGPGLTASANLVANFALPMHWNVEVTMSTPSTWVYSVSFSIM